MGYVGGKRAALRISRVLHRPGFRSGVDTAFRSLGVPPFLQDDTDSDTVGRGVITRYFLPDGSQAALSRPEFERREDR